MRVLSPVGEQRHVGSDQLAPRLANIRGKTIGMIDDGAGRIYFTRIEELLNQTAKPGRIVYKLKPLLSQPAPASLLDEAAEACDAVIVGVGV